MMMIDITCPQIMPDAARSVGPFFEAGGKDALFKFEDQRLLFRPPDDSLSISLCGLSKKNPHTHTRITLWVPLGPVDNPLRAPRTAFRSGPAGSGRFTFQDSGGQTGRQRVHSITSATGYR